MWCTILRKQNGKRATRIQESRNRQVCPLQSRRPSQHRKFYSTPFSYMCASKCVNVLTKYRRSRFVTSLQNKNTANSHGTKDASTITNSYSSSGSLTIAFGSSSRKGVIGQASISLIARGQWLQCSRGGCRIIYFMKQEGLRIKQVPFEHFIFPIKVNPSVLSKISTAYITMDQFKDLAANMRTSQGLVPQDAEILFLFHQLAANGEPNAERPAEVKSFALFLALQSYHNLARHSMFENVNISDVKYQERIQKINNYSPLNSPRAKTIRTNTAQHELQQITQFVKQSLRDFLRLVTSNDDYITSTEFNYLSLILASDQLPLSASVFDRTTKLAQKAVQEMLTKTLSCPEEISIIQGFTKSVTIQKATAAHIKISQCEDSMIYIDSTVHTLSIHQCMKCHIYVAAVKFITSVSSSEQLTLCVASNFLKISNSIDITVNFFGSYSPILYGDCRNVQLGPHNANTVKLLDQIKAAQIPLSKQNRERFNKPIVMGSSRIDFGLQSLEEFSRFLLPEKSFGAIDVSLIEECKFDIDRMAKEITQNRVLAQPIAPERVVIPLLAPPDYMKVVYERHKNFANLQQQLKSQGLKEDHMRLLQNAIQGNFKEWLVSTGSIKGISDLVKLIDQQDQ